MKYVLKILVIFFYIFFHSNLTAAISNSIVVKVNNKIITSIDIQNEIKILLIVGNKVFNQENIDGLKDTAVKSLIRKSIKKNEIEKYEVKNFSQDELENYILNISKKLNTDKKGLKEIFKKNEVDYNKFIEKIKIDLLWNTLIFKMYKNQIVINPLEIEDEIKNILENKKQIKNYKLSEIELSLNKQTDQKYIEKIYESIKNNGFAKSAKNFSVSSSSINDGDIGWFNQNVLSEIYKNKLKNIKVGEVTEPIKIQNSLIILKVQKIKIVENKNYDIEKVKDSLINKKKNEKLNLFSRSHFSGLENSTLIDFK
tara:strand:- start:217 stop:1152 length:936 start_codon:yes stop_codon:yes gene_type:complete